jgi:Baseplate J-like protein
MAVALPNLDNRRWGEIVEEARSLVPVYAPEWTDHNPSDPGITFLELYAWLTEQTLYRLNYIPEQRRWLFLSLAGIVRRDPQPALSWIQAQLNPGQGPVQVPAEVEVEGPDGAGVSTIYRTIEPMTVVAGSLAAIQSYDGKEFRDLSPDAGRELPLSLFGEDPAVGAAFYLGFTDPLPPGKPVRLGFIFEGLRASLDERARLLAEIGEQSRDCAAPPPASCCGKPNPAVTPTAFSLRLAEANPAVRLVWEFSAGPALWRPLETATFEDHTRALTFNGAVLLQVPSPMAAVAVGPLSTPLFYLRCVLAAGVYDRAPVARKLALNAMPVRQLQAARVELGFAAGSTFTGTAPGPGDRVKFTLKLNPEGKISELHFLPSASDAPEFSCLEFTFSVGLPEEKRVFTIEAVCLGMSDGTPAQEFTSPCSPVIAEEFALYSLEDFAWRSWRRRSSFDASGRADADFVLDSQTGEVVFGDGEKGRVPPKAAPLFARVDCTRAQAGQLKAKAIAAFSGLGAPVQRPAGEPQNRKDLDAYRRALHNRSRWPNFDTEAAGFSAVTNFIAAEGGAARETLAEAASRAYTERSKPTRAVTLEDFEALAKQTPGVTLARGWGQANTQPGFECVSAAGVVTVVILPQLPKDHPTPSGATIRAVRAYLSRRRILGTRVEVVGPRYVEVTVRAKVVAFDHTDPAAVRKRVVDALHQFFDPLHGGPEKTGWPFGRDVYRSEVMAVIDAAEGLDHVETLELVRDAECPTCGNLCLAGIELVASGNHQIEVL